MSTAEEDTAAQAISPQFTAYGETPKQLFEDVAQKLAHWLTNPDEVGQALREKLVVEAPDMESLLKGWCTALMNLTQHQKMVFHSFHVLKIASNEKGEYTIQAEVLGELLDPRRHALRQKIKEIVCGHAQIKKDSIGYHADISLNVPSR